MTITNVELRLDGADLIDDPTLRRGLVDLWQAEAEYRRPRRRRSHASAPASATRATGSALAELSSGGDQYVLARAPVAVPRTEPRSAVLKADAAPRSNAWDVASSSARSSAEALDDHGHALAAADAHRLEAERLVRRPGGR